MLSGVRVAIDIEEFHQEFVQDILGTADADGVYTETHSSSASANISLTRENWRPLIAPSTFRCVECASMDTEEIRASQTVC